MLSKNLVFNLFLLSFLIGIFVNNLLCSLFGSIIVALMGVLLFLNFKIYYRFNFALILFIIIGYILGVFISNKNLESINYNKSVLEKYYDNYEHNLVLEIVELNKINDYSIEYVGILKSINQENIETNIKMILSVPSNFEIKKGYTISGESKLYKIEAFNGFSYDKYMLSKDIYFKSYFNSFKLVYKKDLNSIVINIDNFRENLLDIIYKLYPKNEAIFLGGILFGARESLPDDLKQDFNNSGLTHFIAVSGFNITIIVVFFSFLFKYFPIFLRVILITFTIGLFILLVGDTAPVIRASIMGLVGYYILVSGRKGNMITIVLFTSFIMALVSPFILNWDISFALSFLAVLGIYFLQGYFNKLFSFLPDILAIREAFVLTMSATIFALPIMIFNFGQLSLISPVSNVAMAWTIPLAMLFGFLSVIAYFLYIPLAFIVGYIDYMFLHYDMLVVSLFGNMDYMLLKFDFGVYKYYFMILYFMCLVFLIVYFRDEKKEG